MGRSGQLAPLVPRCTRGQHVRAPGQSFRLHTPTVQRRGPREILRCGACTASPPVRRRPRETKTGTLTYPGAHGVLCPPSLGRRIGVVQLIGLLLAFLLTAGLGGVLTAGLVMPVVATTNVITSTSVNLFEDLPTELAEVPLSEKSTVLASDGTVLAEFYFQNRIVVTLDQISQPMRDAVIAVEDHRFYEHGGIDPTGLLRALVHNATHRGGGTQGGSTLTQQYVKNALIQNAQQGEDEEVIAAAITSSSSPCCAFWISAFFTYCWVSVEPPWVPPPRWVALFTSARRSPVGSIPPCS